jgi:hypothetical protein
MAKKRAGTKKNSGVAGLNTSSSMIGIGAQKSYGDKYLDIFSFPTDYYGFLFKSLLIWFCINLGSILIYSVIYYYYDKDNHVSKFNGMEDGERYYYEYLYLSSMVGTIVGFGDITAKRDSLTKFIIISQVVVTLALNFIFLTFKELKLADDPDGTYTQS